MLAVLLTCCMALAPQDIELIENGKVALEDGSVVAGKISIQPDKKGGVTIRHVRKSRKPKLRSVLLVVDGEGAVAHPDELDLDLLPAFASLVGEVRDKSGAYLRYARKIPEGASGLAAALLRESLLIDPGAEDALAMLRSVPDGERLMILRAVLTRHPNDENMRADVRALLPGGFSAPEPFNALGWVDFLRVAKRRNITIIHDPDDEAAGWDIERRKLGTARTSKVWGRRDLVGYRSEHIYLITPVHDPGIIGACLQRGETTAHTLVTLFDGVEKMREPRYPMMVYLYESREEYLAVGEGVRQRGQDESHDKTAGKFFPRDGTSKFYVPVEEDARERMLKTLAHELTHHWLHACCPGFTTAQAARALANRGPQRPGHWIVEGFASMVECFAFNDVAGTFEMKNPRAPRLGIVANAEPGQLIPWRKLFTTTYVGFHELDKEQTVRVPFGWKPNTFHVVTEWGMYYAQAASASHYLYTHDTKTRKQLLDYVTAYYSGKSEGLDVTTAFELSAQELGKRTREHVSEVCGN